MFLNLLDNKLVPRRKRAVKFEGEHFIGEIYRITTEYNTYGLRSDWHNDYNIGIKVPGLEKTVWFKTSKPRGAKVGDTIEIYGRIKGEYERSIQLNYVKIKSINNKEIDY